MVLIEDIVAVENLDEILTVDHIDVFFVAPSDLAQSMGYVGQTNHPDVTDVIDGAIAKIVAAGRNPGARSRATTDVESKIEKGVKFMMASLDRVGRLRARRSSGARSRARRPSSVDLWRSGCEPCVMKSDAADLIPASQLDIARLIASAAEQASVEPYLVGGAVRDALLGRSSTGDLDITLVGADAATFAHIARITGGRITSKPLNSIRPGWKLESAPWTSPWHGLRLTLEPGSLPVVRPGTLAEDLSRRDFTVNAMAVSLGSDRWGRLFDPHGGQDDLRKGQIRTLHEGSFLDDATRILRAARYAARLSFDLDDTTRHSLDRSIGFLSTISSARLRNELERIFHGSIRRPNRRHCGRSTNGARCLLYTPAIPFDSSAWHPVRRGV